MGSEMCIRDRFFDDGEYTALFADGAVSAACGYAAGQQAYAVYQNGEAVTVKDVEKNIKVLEMAAHGMAFGLPTVHPTADLSTATHLKANG